MLKLIIDKLYMYKVNIMILFIVNIIISFLLLINPYITGKYIDILSTTKTQSILVTFIMVYFVIKISQIVSSYTYNILLLKLRLNLIFEFYKTFTEHVINLPLVFFKNKTPIYLSQRIHADLNKLIEFILTDIYKFIATIFTLIFITLIFINKDQNILMLAILSCCIYTYIFFAYKRKIQESSFKYFEAENRYAATINEPYDNIKSIRQNSIYSIFLKRLECGFRNFFNTKITYGRVSYLYSNSTDSVYAISSSIAMLYCGIQVINNHLTIGEAIYITNYYSIILTSLGALLSLGQKYKEFIVSYDRLNEVVETETVSNGNIELDKIKSIQIDSLSYGYDKALIVSDFNYTFNIGNIYAISGTNGKGKSTLLNILSGVLKASDGAIYYNDININDLDMILLRRKHISFMSQDVFILSDTIENNINLDINTLNEDVLNDYIELFNFKEYLSKNNISLKETINNTLSEGEKQKIGLLRSSIKNSKLLILDEPTSSLDINTTQKLKEYLLKIKSEKIIIIVSHDEKILDIADHKINLNEMALVN
ncbi:MAG: ATP-binding cassette domain-containing protein [Paraclostridium sp.]